MHRRLPSTTRPGLLPAELQGSAATATATACPGSLAGRIGWSASNRLVLDALDVNAHAAATAALLAMANRSTAARLELHKELVRQAWVAGGSGGPVIHLEGLEEQL